MSKATVSLSEIKESPIQWANNTRIPILEALLKKASNLYYNTDKTILSDEEYDILLEVLEKRKPDSKLLKNIGADIEENIEMLEGTEKITLPIYMGSMDKVKTRDGVKNWLKDYSDSFNPIENTYVVSDKLDGASALLIYEKGELKMYTRGNGKIGRNISTIAQNMLIPHYSFVPEGSMIRGELIVTKQNFQKYKEKYSSSRAMVNGIIGSKTLDVKLLKVLDFVAFELVEPVLKPSIQFKKLKEYGFKTPNVEKTTLKQLDTWNTINNNIDDSQDISKDITEDKNRVIGSFIYNTLLKHRSQSKYEIDGIIITHDKIYPRNTSGNPKHSFAFKANSDGILTTVVKIIWNTSKHGYLIPTVEVEPIDLGSIVKHATGFNAKYILDNNLGPGSKIKVNLSGEVIPYITQIVESTQAQMPTCNYVWNKTKVNIILENPEENKELQHKTILTFFRTIGVENLSTGIIKRLIDNNFDSIKKIIEMTKLDFLGMDGIQEKMANKLYNNIHKVVDNTIEASWIMSASLKFGHGFGIKRFDAILQKYPDILNIDVNYELIEAIDGFSHITAKQFVDNLDKFKEFMVKHPMIKLHITDATENIESNLFEGKKFVLTGARDKEIIEFINNNGGVISNNIKKDTYMLIAKNIDITSSKASAAQLLGIEMKTIDKFKSQYNLSSVS